MESNGRGVCALLACHLSRLDPSQARGQHLEGLPGQSELMGPAVERQSFFIAPVLPRAALARHDRSPRRARVSGDKAWRAKNTQPLGFLGLSAQLELDCIRLR